MCSEHQRVSAAIADDLMLKSCRYGVQMAADLDGCISRLQCVFTSDNVLPSYYFRSVVALLAVYATRGRIMCYALNMTLHNTSLSELRLEPRGSGAADGLRVYVAISSHSRVHM